MANYHKAKRRFGQNFLVDEGCIESIVDSLNLTDADAVIEIGPGKGAMTSAILACGVEVAAIEIDRDLHELLESEFAHEPRFQLVKGDVLKIDLATIFPDRRPKVAGNLPFNISTPILSRLIECREGLDAIVLMFQREVVDRLIALPGNSDRGYMSVLAQAAFEMERVVEIPPTAFRPAPQVSSSVIVLTAKPVNFADEPAFSTLLSRSFAQKRKTLSNNLKQWYATDDIIAKASDLDLSRRAETLDLAEWQTLYNAVK